MLEIRQAEARDADRIGELLLQVEAVHHAGRPDIFRPGAVKYTREELLTLMKDPDRPIFVAETAETGAGAERSGVLGYAFCILKRVEGDKMLTDNVTLYVDDLCVDENVRGQKIGTALLDYVVGYARSVGCTAVTLNVWSCNPAAVGFYRAYGMKEQKIGMELLL